MLYSQGISLQTLLGETSPMPRVKGLMIRTGNTFSSSYLPFVFMYAIHTLAMDPSLNCPCLKCGIEMKKTELEKSHANFPSLCTILCLVIKINLHIRRYSALYSDFRYGNLLFK